MTWEKGTFKLLKFNSYQKKKKDKKYDFFWLRTTEVQKDLQFLELQIEERAEILFFTCIFIQVAFI